jgi:hypothetical protein
MVKLSFHFIVRTCDMKAFEEQVEQDRNQEQKQETMKHYRQHQQRACIVIHPSHSSFHPQT